MTQTTPSSGSNGENQNKTNPPFAYNEGGGVKDQIVMTGPLSEVLSRAMGVFFEKKPLTTQPESPEADMPQAPATESYSQDQRIEAMVSAMQDDQGMELVLDNFNVNTVDDHMRRLASGEIANAPDTPAPTAIYVTTANDLLTPSTAEDLFARQSDNDVTLVTIIQDVDNAIIAVPDEGCPPPEEMREAIERIYEGTGVVLCWGVEAMCAHLLVKKFKTIKEARRVTTAVAKEGFAAWFTRKKKTLLEQLDEVAELCKNYSKDASLPMQPHWRHLVKNNNLFTEDAINIGKNLIELCDASKKFIATGFKLTGSNTSKSIDAVPMQTNFKRCFGRYKFTGKIEFSKTGTAASKNNYVLYDSINGKFLLIQLLEMSELDPLSYSRPFASYFYDTYPEVTLPLKGHVDGSDIQTLIETARTLVTTAIAELENTSDLEGAERTKGYEDDEDVEGDVSKCDIFNSYAGVLSSILEGVFKESIAFGEATVSLAKAYAKAAK